MITIAKEALMPLTRNPHFPVEIAQLLAAFNVCADGQHASTVLNAGLQLVAASIGFIARENGGTLAQAEAYLAGVATPTMLAILRDNWQREPSPDDVPVLPS
jgi:hypothetical protein